MFGLFKRNRKSSANLVGDAFADIRDLPPIQPDGILAQLLAHPGDDPKDNRDTALAVKEDSLCNLAGSIVASNGNHEQVSN